jgi:antibiotic biosynthesis monooxygenase (ABM) superfamily enzyme
VRADPLDRPTGTGPAVIGVALFHPAPDAGRFTAWARSLLAAAATHDGFAGGAVEVPAEPGFDWVISTAFDTVAQLDAWLDGPVRRQLLADGRVEGAHRAHADLVLRGPEPPGAGTGVLEQLVEPGRVEEFRAAQRRLVQLSSTFPGFVGAAVVPVTGPDAADPEGATRWWSILRFRTGEQLAGWMHSRERAAALPELRSALGEEFTDVSASTPFGSIVRVHDGRTRTTPEWKSAALVLLVLYPTVMLLSRFVGPVLADWGTPQWLAMWLSQILSVGLMTYLFMPWVTGWFRRWLDPIDGAGRRTTLIGLLVVLVVYAVSLGLFGSVQWLQFWDYAD